MAIHRTLPPVVLYDASNNPMAVANGVALPTSGLVIMGAEGSNARFLQIKAASTAPVATDPAAVVTLSPNSATLTTQTALRTPGVAHGKVSSSAIAIVRNTTYTEQSTDAQRSIVSSSTSDTSAGTGARTVKITYYTAENAGPFTETLTLNGTTAVNTVSTTISLIESIIVLTAGSFGSNIGTISLKTTTGGGGTTIASIAVADNQTFFAHHNIATGVTCYVRGLHVSGTVGALFFWRQEKAPDDATEALLRIDEMHVVANSSFQRMYGDPIKIAGPAEIHVGVVPDANGGTYFATLDFFEV